jgi:uncharacterized protein YegP (UPF0339 family)
MINDDYMGCDFYQNQAKDANKEGFTTFFDKATAKFYFAYVNVKTGKVIFRSEGYPTAAAQKNGLNSVIKNMPNEKQFSIAAEGDQYVVILKAKNHVEIARTCPVKTKNEAETLVLELTGKVILSAPKVAAKTTKVVAAKATKTTAVPQAAAAKSMKTVEVKAEVKTDVAPKAKTTTAKVVVAKVEAPKAAKTTTAKVETKKLTSSYAQIEAYLGHETLVDEFGQTGFALFTAAKNHYFVVYNQDGSIFQRSTAFTTTEERNNKFQSMKNVITNENAYQIVQESNTYSVKLVAENGEVLSSSTEFFTYADAHYRTPKGWSQPVEMVGTMY